MSRENIEVLRRAYEEYNAGRLLEYFARHVDADFELDMSDWGPADYTYRGPDGFRSFLLSLARFWERFDIEPEEFVDAGDRVVAIIRVDARGSKSGVEVAGQFANTWTFRDGKIVRAEWSDDPSAALEAAKRSERAMSQENVEIEAPDVRGPQRW